MSGLIRQFYNKISVFNKNYTSIIRECPVIPSILNSQQRFYSNAPTPHEVVNPNEEKLITEEVIKNVNQQVSQGTQGRLFAVVQVAGKQFKITEGDLVIIEGYWPPEIGDKISLDKILMLGGSDFTLIGRPLIESGLANVHATVIEKMLSYTKTNFKKKRRKQYKRIHFYRIPQTMLRINKVEFVGVLNTPPDVSGLDYVVL